MQASNLLAHNVLSQEKLQISEGQWKTEKFPSVVTLPKIILATFTSDTARFCN